MTSLLSTSSSSLAPPAEPVSPAKPRTAVPTRAAPSVAVQVARLVRRRRVPLPWGAAWAVGCVVVVHLVFTVFVYPDPMAGPNQRRKFLAIPPDVSPTVLIAGDSRMQCGVLPRQLAEQAGLDPVTTFNVAVPAGEPAALAAAVREWRPRIAEGSIVVLGVSLCAVNDGAHDSYIGDEGVWWLDPLERLRLVSPRRALLATFLPEREALRRWIQEPFFQQWDLSRARKEQGYQGKQKAKPLSALEVRGRVQELRSKWIGQPHIDGLRMELLRRALADLRAGGYQPVVVDLPEHPLLPEAIAGTMEAEVMAEFHAALAETVAAAGVPLLTYDAGMLGPDAGHCFVSLMHLDRQGAERFTALIGRDLRQLLEDGVLRPPAIPKPSPGKG